MQRCISNQYAMLCRLDFAQNATMFKSFIAICISDKYYMINRINFAKNTTDKHFMLYKLI